MPAMIEAREYKILLKPAAFSGEPDASAARAFYEDRILPVVGTVPGVEAEGEFDDGAVRDVRFLETMGLVLKKSGLALRLRTKQGNAEATLKLRLPDLFVAAGTALPGPDGKKADTKFEEDIAPLEARRDGRLTVADPPSIRSRFSRSTSQDHDGGLATLGDAFGLYPTLQDVLAQAEPPFARTDPLVGGPRIRETVFKGAKADLGKHADAEFALTWWEFLDPAEVQQVAEISYKVETQNGEMAENSARRGLRLFIGLQKRLKDWLDLDHPSKTELALPPATG